MKSTAIKRLLRESFVQSEPKVDHAAGIIRGVKVLGRTSPNRHGVGNVDGTEYTNKAMRDAIPLFQSRPVMKNHPPRETPNIERKIEEAIGWLESVELREDGLYADLHLLTSDKDTPKVMESAEKNPRMFGLSHNALGRGDVHGRTYVVEEIPELVSIDLVTRPATVSSLFESLEKPMAKSLKQIVESCSNTATKPYLVKLQEMMGETYEDMEMPDAGPDADFKDHLFNAYKALSESDPAKANEILNMLKLEAEEEVKEEETEEKPPVEEHKMESKEAKSATDPRLRSLQESNTKLQKSNKELLVFKNKTELTEWCRDECTKRELTCDKPLLEGLLRMNDKSFIGQHLDYLQGLGLRSTIQKPRSQSPGTGKPLQESRDSGNSVSKPDVPKTKEEQLAWLRN